MTVGRSYMSKFIEESWEGAFEFTVIIAKYYFKLSKKSSFRFKICLAARRLIVILSQLARKALSVRLFYCETRFGSQFVASPSPVIFSRALASKVRKVLIKMQTQRDEASERLVKHYIMISLPSFL